MAIHMGDLRWHYIDSPEAFSLSACYHWQTLATKAEKLGGNDVMSMHLRVKEGNGISESDVKRAMKGVLLAPKEVDVLSKQLGVFLVMCWAIFCIKSDINKEELTGWGTISWQMK
jgi:hypothetical protein